MQHRLFTASVFRLHRFTVRIRNVIDTYCDKYKRQRFNNNFAGYTNLRNSVMNKFGCVFLILVNCSDNVIQHHNHAKKSREVTDV